MLEGKSWHSRGRSALVGAICYSDGNFAFLFGNQPQSLIQRPDTPDMHYQCRPALAHPFANSFRGLIRSCRRTFADKAFVGSG